MMRTYSPAFLPTFLIVAMLVVCVSAAAKGANQGNGKPAGAAQLYARHCASCHGADGRAKTSKGRFSHARDLTDAKWQDDVTDERIFNSIMNGRNVRGNMPAFSDKLKEKDADDLVRYVRRFKG